MACGSGVRGSLRPGRWLASLTVAVLCASAVFVRYSGATEIVNPHESAQLKFCLNCHTEEVYVKLCNESEGYCLLGGSVDGICLTCHIKEECCKPGLLHLPKLHLGMRSHPSDLVARDIPKDFYPKTLPIHLGRITCLTCHLHTRVTGGYKMLRLVKITGRGVDWSILCLDCHKDR